MYLYIFVDIGVYKKRMDFSTALQDKNMARMIQTTVLPIMNQFKWHLKTISWLWKDLQVWKLYVTYARHHNLLLRRVGLFNLSLGRFGFCDPWLKKSWDYLSPLPKL